MGPSRALAEDEELRPLITDLASGPFALELARFAAVFAGLGMSSVAGMEAGFVFAGISKTELQSLALLRGLLLTLPRPANAMAADDVMGVDVDRADFLSSAPARRDFATLCEDGPAVASLSANAADDFGAVDNESTDFASDFGFLRVTGAAGSSACLLSGVEAAAGAS